MKKRFAVAAAALWLAAVLVPAGPAAQAEAPRAEAPVLLTSCGQSPGPVMLKVIMQKAGVPLEFNSLATAADLQAGRNGAPYGSVMIVMGASMKGMGAAGIAIEDELRRTAELIAAARKAGIKVIGAHIEGMKRRAQGASAGDTTDEQSIDAVAPNSDILVITKEGDGDGRFTTIATGKNIPMVAVERTMDLVAELQKLFGKS